MNAIEFYKQKILEEYKNTGDYMSSVATASMGLTHEQYTKIQLAMKEIYNDSDCFNRAVYSWNPEMNLKDPSKVSDEKLNKLSPSDYENIVLVNHDKYNQTKKGLIYNQQTKEFALWVGQGLSAYDKSPNVMEVSGTKIIERAKELAAIGFTEVRSSNPSADTSLSNMLVKKDLIEFQRALPKISTSELEKIKREDFMNEYFSTTGENCESIKNSAINAKPDKPDSVCKNMTAQKWWLEAIDHAYHGCAITLLEPVSEVKMLEKYGFIQKGSYNNDSIFDHLIETGKASDMIVKIMYDYLKDTNTIKASVKPELNKNNCIERN